MNNWTEIETFCSIFSLSHFKSSDYGIMLKVQLKIVKLYASLLFMLSFLSAPVLHQVAIRYIIN